MPTKRPVDDPNETYVLDDDDIRELDEVSLTGVMRDATNTIKRMQIEQEKADRQAGDDEGDELDLGFLDTDD